MKNIDWTGVYPALLTPFTEDGLIDFNWLDKSIRSQMTAGANGIIVGGSLGEASTLGQLELLQLLVRARDTTRNTIPVIVNIAAATTIKGISIAQRAEKEGADGLMLLPPMRYKADSRETLTYLSSVASATSLPVMLYNNPHDYGIEITLEMFEVLANIPQVQAVKESTRDVTNVTRIKNAFGDRYKILCGVDTLALEELAAGADGWVAGLVNAFPAETVAIYNLVKSGQLNEALKIYRWFMPLLELDIHPKLVQYIKLAAVQTGRCSEWVRAPRLLLEGNERERVLTIIEDAIRIRPAIPADINTAQPENDRKEKVAY